MLFPLFLECVLEPFQCLMFLICLPFPSELDYWRPSLFSSFLQAMKNLLVSSVVRKRIWRKVEKGYSLFLLFCRHKRSQWRTQEKLFFLFPFREEVSLKEKSPLSISETEVYDLRKHSKRVLALLSPINTCCTLLCKMVRNKRVKRRSLKDKVSGSEGQDFWVRRWRRNMIERDFSFCSNPFSVWRLPRRPVSFSFERQKEIEKKGFRFMGDDIVSPVLEQDNWHSRVFREMDRQTTSTEIECTLKRQMNHSSGLSSQTRNWTLV